MTHATRRIAVRAALVVVGVTLCLFGPARHSGLLDRVDESTPSTIAGVAIDVVDHAVAERPSARPTSDAGPLLPYGVLLTVVLAFAWALAARRGERLADVVVTTTWRRRGPPATRV